MSRRSHKIVHTGIAQPVAYATLMVAGLVTGLVLGLAPASASVSWHGDYETGSFSQWSSVQEKASDRAQVVTSPLRQGSYAARFTVQPGDTDVAGSGSWVRSEAMIGQSTSDGVEGHENWYAWSMLTPPAGQPINVYQATQFHPTGSGGSGQTGFSISSSYGLNFHAFGEPDPGSSNTRKYDATVAPYQADHWYDIVFHVLWSKDRSKGFFEVFVDGKQVVPLTHAATLFAVDDGVYMKQGIYTGPETYAMTLVYDGTRRGSSYQDVVADFPAGEWPVRPPS